LDSDLVPSKPTAITRSDEAAWQARGFGVAASLLGGAVIIAVGVTDLPIPNALLFTVGGVGALALILGLVVGINSFTSAGSATCPECGRVFQMLEESGQGVPRFCRGCRNYVEAKDGVLQMTEDASVVAAPIFRATLPKEMVWPDGCCVCRGPATRMIAISTVAQTPGQALGTLAADVTMEVVTGHGLVVLAGNRYTIQVPHCADHADGALLQVNSDQQIKVLFRSYAYQRAFCDLNGVKPG
jgi:hypothetical protein